MHTNGSTTTKRGRTEVGGTDAAQWADDALAPAGRATDDGGSADASRASGDRRGRSTAEWVTLGISAAIVFGLVALTTYFHLTGGSDPPVIKVRAESDRTYRGGAVSTCRSR